jgi:hypothetical protein
MQGYEQMWTNYSLTLLSQILRGIRDEKRTFTPGKDEVTNKLRWKETDLTRAIKGSFFGKALTAFIFCVSQHEVNGSETWFSVTFADDCRGLRSNVIKQSPSPLLSIIK